MLKDSREDNFEKGCPIPQPNIGTHSQTDCCDSRQSFRQSLQLKIFHLEMQLRGLRALELALPMTMPEEADHAMWSLLNTK